MSRAAGQEGRAPQGRPEWWALFLSKTPVLPDPGLIGLVWWESRMAWDHFFLGPVLGGEVGDSAALCPGC